ncbi:MAG: CpsD/CapB family tyrosine-protein kinase [Parvularculaceae bacterium]
MSAAPDLTHVSRAERDQRLGATLVRMGKLDGEAINRIVEAQRRMKAPFASAASRLGLVSKEDLHTALGVQHGFLRIDETEGKLPKAMLTVRRPASPEAAQFRAMRARMLTSKNRDDVKAFAIASNTTSRESDYVALNLAASFAQLKKRVLLVDTDMRAPRLARYFSMPAGPGLRDVLGAGIDIRNAIRASIVSNLSVLTAGEGAGDADDLLAGDLLRLSVEYLRCAYDNVIYLTTPFGASTDAQFVWSTVGNVMVVTRRNEDRMAQLKSLHGALRQVDANIIGAALAG